MSSTRIRITFVLTALLVGLIGTVPGQAQEVMPVTFDSITPVEGTTLYVARTAADNPLDPPTFQLKADVVVNRGSTDAELQLVTFRYPNSSIPDWSYQPKLQVDHDNNSQTAKVLGPFVVPASPGDMYTFPIYDGLTQGRDLPTPLPDTVEIQIDIANNPSPIFLRYNLEFRENDVPNDAFFFPAKAEDLDPGERWFFKTRHVVDSHAFNELQPDRRWSRFALDMEVRGWNDEAWDHLIDSSKGKTDNFVNSDYRVYGVPLYSMGDGTIVECYRGEPEKAPWTGGDVPYNAGNSLRILYGEDLVTYAHLQDASLPEELCPTPSEPGPGLWPSEEPQEVSIPVTIGMELGEVGNNGQTSNPHLHIQVENRPASGPDTIMGVPLQFLNIRALSDEDTVQNIDENAVLQPLHGKALHKHSLIVPNPCGLDVPSEGLTEVSRHGIPAECYQDVVNMVTARGYRLAFTDGYDVGGDTFFNATFRPAGPAQVAHHGMTGTDYQAAVNNLTDDGYRLHQVDSYLQNGTVRYAAIFEKRPGPDWAAFHGLNEDEYGDEVDELSDSGFVPVNISTVEVDGQTYWTGLFEAVDADGWSIHSVPAGDYQDVFNDNQEVGRVPMYVHGYSTVAGPHITGVFVDPGGVNVVAEHGLSGAEYQTVYDVNSAAGRFTRYTTGYDVGGAHEYAAIWRHRPQTTITTSPPAITNQTTAGFGLAADHPFTTFECSLDLAEWSACANPHTFTGVGEGTHVLAARSIDRLLVTDLSPAAHTWLVDLTPPEVEITNPAAGEKISHGVQRNSNKDTIQIVGWGDVVVDASDALSGVDEVLFVVDGGTPVAGAEVDADTWSFRFEPNLRGQTTYDIEVVVSDLAGNTNTDAIVVSGTSTGR